VALIYMEPLIISDPSKCAGLTSMIERQINRGGSGSIIQLTNGMVVKQRIDTETDFSTGEQRSQEQACLDGKGCENDILLEGLTMHVLNSLGSKHFARLEGLYKCNNDYFLVMEKLDGMDYTTYLKRNPDIDPLDRLTILVQITYALYLANSQFDFVHGDLIGRNVMIVKVPESIETYKIGSKTIRASNRGLRVVLVDFGFSRIRQNGIDIFRVPQNITMFPTEEDLFNGTADICKIYGNPNFKLDNFNTTIIGGRRLSDIIKECQSYGWSYVAVPPFPAISAEDILKSSLFDNIVITTKDFNSSVQDAIKDAQEILLAHSET
jgi:serine/threonine protein kinase